MQREREASWNNVFVRKKKIDHASIYNADNINGKSFSSLILYSFILVGQYFLGICMHKKSKMMVDLPTFPS